jgi:hypothetical protein
LACPFPPSDFVIVPSAFLLRSADFVLLALSFHRESITYISKPEAILEAMHTANGQNAKLEKKGTSLFHPFG